MRYSVLATALVLGACSAGSPSEPVIPGVPTNPLIAFLASEPSTYLMSKLGADEASPFRINQSVCLGLPRHDDVVDSIFFHGDGTYRRVYRAYSLMWRTIGVPEPVEMTTRYKIEQTGTVGGEGDVVTLRVLQYRQNDDPFEPFAPVPGRTDMAFAISGTMFTKGETLGTGCEGQRTATIAEFTRASE